MKQAFLDHIELWLSAFGLFLILAILYFLLARLLRKLEEKNRRLRNLARRIQSAREKERARIAREVHDVLGQALTSLQFDVVWLLDQTTTPSSHQKLREMEVIIEATLQTAQEITTELRPGVLDELGIVAALGWQTRRLSRETDLRVHFSSDCEHVPLSQSRATAVFRIAQEALANVLQHAEASEVNVCLETRAKNLVLTVEDDGRGIAETEARAPSALGILGMQERAAEWDGKLCVERISSNGGTRLTLRMPVGKRTPEEEKGAND